MFKKKSNINDKWITKGIRLSCKYKRNLHTLIKKSNDDELKLYHKRYCTILVRVIREAKKMYYHELISKSENKIQSTWKIINKETAINRPTDNIVEIQAGKSKLNNPNDLANVFNRFFQQ